MRQSPIIRTVAFFSVHGSPSVEQSIAIKHLKVALLLDAAHHSFLVAVVVSGAHTGLSGIESQIDLLSLVITPTRNVTPGQTIPVIPADCSHWTALIQRILRYTIRGVWVDTILVIRTQPRFVVITNFTAQRGTVGNRLIRR
uniref:(northern house mosquito) hypothetical protein n=1 Tax=Culex pipiens TaxID=7175 RepID=A0A8D8AWQ4_CULPI